MFNSSNPVPGANSAWAFGHQEREISAVSLIFSVGEEIESASVVEGITGDPISFDLFEEDDRVVATLYLQRGTISNPHLVFNETLTFKALLTPMHDLSTFDELEFGGDNVFLRDYDVEKEVELGDSTEFLPEELVDLWVGDHLARAGRAKFTNPGSAGDFVVSAPACETAVYRKNRLVTSKTCQMNLDYQERVTVLVIPIDDDAIIDVSVTN